MSARNVSVTILNGESHMQHRRSHARRSHARHNPDAMQAGKSLAAAVVAATATAYLARKTAEMKNADGAVYSAKKSLAIVGIGGAVIGLGIASMKYAHAPVIGTAVLSATAALTLPSLYTIYSTPAAAGATPPASDTTAASDTPPAGQRAVAVGSPRLMSDGSPVLDAAGAPVLRTRGLFGLTASDVAPMRRWGY
jgi:hypothetical protein